MNAQLMQTFCGEVGFLSDNGLKPELAIGYSGKVVASCAGRIAYYDGVSALVTS